MTAPKLIITADDYGMSPLFNRGIEELASLGLITGISVMIKRPFVYPEKLRSLKISLGLHLELEPVAKKEDIVYQITLFQEKFGRLPVYLDGHQHQHLTAENLPLILAVAKKYQLPVRSRFSEDREKLRLAAIATPDTFISWHPTRIPTLEERMKQALQFPVSELVVHPGYFDPRCDYPYNQEREAELGFLQSSSFQEMITPFVLTNFTAI
ncbi:ChbG/HpnK family deacetylase [Candidatus Dojkabacteria bacterium]|uniref:ChbG/HpnK family deacetylase n=1 Tax=Candidatus Dojkabacteria bacterium TaxID=2099670 RepID=A0A5C7J6I5_9BACT|nr:MAG: ChbG/HpnK family deacetylase [Candidatus Dojkabacteria bacterium]